jgi:hypothetical protein
MIGEIATTTECDDECNMAEPVRLNKEGVDFTIYMSSVFCPFRNFIRFLEAVFVEVQQCEFYWEAERSDGRMRWKRRSTPDAGLLTVEWYSDKPFGNQISLNTREAVSVLYSAFRTFVDSPDYDPLRYERLTFGEGFALMLSDASLSDLAGVLVRMNAKEAKMVLRSLGNNIRDRHMKGPKLSFPIKYFLDATEPVEPSSEYNEWIKAGWNGWDADRRMLHLEELFSWGGMGWFGENLREIQSKLIEEWLALPDALRHPNYRIPS